VKVGMLSVFQAGLDQGLSDLDVSFNFAGMPFDYAESSMRLFAEKVLPTLQQWICEPMEKQANS